MFLPWRMWIWTTIQLGNILCSVQLFLSVLQNGQTQNHLTRVTRDRLTDCGGSSSLVIQIKLLFISLIFVTLLNSIWFASGQNSLFETWVDSFQVVNLVCQFGWKRSVWWKTLKQWDMIEDHVRQEKGRTDLISWHKNRRCRWSNSWPL